MKKLQLVNSKSKTLIDNEDFAHISKYEWRTNGKYVYTNIGKEIVYIHRLILNTPKGFYTDHIDGNTFNNQRNNLRICSMSENRANSRKVACRVMTSPYKGVHKKSANRNWSCAIAYKGKRFNLGSFVNEEDAANAYDQKAKELFGRFAKLNFPN